MLTSEEIQAVQGEPIQETKPSAPAEAMFAISQCYFALPTASNSVVVTVTQRADGPVAADPKEYWRETFHPGEEHREREEEGEHKTPPAEVAGVGEEAFWTGNAIGGALYAIKGDRFLRISVGGGGDPGAKMEKTKTLAQAALKRL